MCDVRLTGVAAAALCVCFFAAAGRGGAEGPLPRIATRGAQFVEGASGRVVRPRGFNYIRLRPRWHGTFAPGLYDADKAEAMVGDLRRGGFNVVRVFIDPAAGEGIVESPGAEGLSKAYLDNFVDFLARCRRGRLYVIPSLLDLPPGKRYNAIVGRARKGFGVGNEMYLDERYVRAKAAYVGDFVAAVKRADAGLLSTVFAYELDNETRLYADGEPFNRREGTYAGPAGKTCDCSRDADLQRLADDAVGRWADACVEAARAVDAEAMVSVNVFTFRAVGRTGPGALHGATTKDRRFPARPLALTRTKLSYLDIHFYPFDANTLDADLASIEFDELSKACKARGKPLIMGEFGAFKRPWPALDRAAAAMTSHLARVRVLGFEGFLYWTYDTDEQPFLWNARSGRGEIFDALRAAPGWAEEEKDKKRAGLGD